MRERNLAPRTIKTLIAALLIGGLFVGAGSTSADELKPSADDQAITKSVLDLVQQKHILKKEFDRAMAVKALDSYINALDPWKQYFLQADLTEFNRRKADLADELNEGDIAIAFDVYRRFQQRVQEAGKVWADLLKPDTKIDFDAKEVVVIDRKAREYSKDANSFREQWRLWLKYSLLSTKTDPDAKNFELAKACKELLTSYNRYARGVNNTKPYQVLESFLGHVGAQFDNGTTYTSPASIQKYQEGLRGNFVGIGVQLAKDGRITSLIAGGPAQAEGNLKPNDRLVSVGQGANGEMKDVTALTLDEAIEMIRGEEGTTVRLGVRRAGENPVREIVLRRGKVTAPDTKVEARIEAVGGLKIGYLDVPSFYQDDMTNDSTGTEVRKQLERFTNQSVDVAVLDLRRCRGGYLNQAAELAGLFIGQGPIFQWKNQTGELKTSNNENTAMAWNKPLVVLTGTQTASGAELVFALQDYKRGLIVGDDQTYGLGLIRSQLNVPNKLGLLMVTTGQFYRCTGESVQQRGVKPDVVIPTLDSARGNGGQAESSNIGFDRVKAVEIPSQSMVSNETVLSLRASSRARRRETADFKTLQTLIEWEQSQSARSIETLEEKAYRDRMKDTPTNKLPEEKEGEADFYLKEIFKITAEYTKAVANKTAVAANIQKAPPPVDPSIAQAQERANQREATRQEIDELTDQIRITNNKITAATGLALLAQLAYDDADSIFERAITGAAFIAAQRAVEELKGERDRLESDLQSARSRYNRLRD